MLNIRGKICGQSLSHSYFCNTISQENKVSYLNLSYNLLNRNLNSKHHLTICIYGNTEKNHIRGVLFIGIDYNRFLWIYKITRFNYCFDSGWIRGGCGSVCRIGWGWGFDVKFWTFAGGGITKVEQVQARVEDGSKFLSTCENAITECPLTRSVLLLDSNISWHQFGFDSCNISNPNLFLMASTVTLPFRFLMWLTKDFFFFIRSWLKSNRFVTLISVIINIKLHFPFMWEFMSVNCDSSRIPDA